MPYSTVPTLACMACFDLLSEYRYPLINGLIGTILGWAALVVLTGVTRRGGDRSTDRRGKGVRSLAILALVLTPFGLLTFTLRPLTPVFGFVWAGVVAVELIRHKQKWPRIVHGIALSVFVVLVLTSYRIRETAAHQVAWLGRIPPHGGWNAAPVDWVIAHADEAGPLVEEQLRQLLDPAHPGPEDHSQLRRLSILCRTVGAMESETACGVLQAGVTDWTPEVEKRVVYNARAAVLLSAAQCGGEIAWPPLHELWSAPDSTDDRLVLGLALMIADPEQAEAEDVLRQALDDWKSRRQSADERSQANLAELIRSLSGQPTDHSVTLQQVTDELYPEIR